MMDENDQTTSGEQSRCLGGRFEMLDRLGAGGGAVVVRARACGRRGVECDL